MPESSEIVVLTIVETCEARVVRFIYQERSRKQFSPLWRFCEARAGLFNGQGYRESSFHHWEGAVMFVLACLSDRKHRKCCFHNRGEPVKLVEVCISARKDQESSFHHCGGSVKFVQACLSFRNRRESSFHHCGVSVKLLQDCLSA